MFPLVNLLPLRRNEQWRLGRLTLSVVDHELVRLDCTQCGLLWITSQHLLPAFSGAIQRLALVHAYRHCWRPHSPAGRLR